MYSVDGVPFGFVIMLSRAIAIKVCIVFYMLIWLMNTAFPRRAAGDTSGPHATGAGPAGF